ncbi:2-dehydropantoate 2-reductase N-terminal domain-containing protein [Mycobacterium sp.]|uniref:2-dehydropantoate 2-reductase N-terminal domain-containing protein n=1 Tax=Mycobacterium sp. TaxID=1785 RepID=UPI003BAE181A
MERVAVVGPGAVGLVLLAIKATQNADRARWPAGLCDENTKVVVLQNGVEQVEQIQPLCPWSTVIPGIVWFSAETCSRRPATDRVNRSIGGSRR